MNRRRLPALFATVTLVATSLTAVASSAQASPGPGTFTRITTPSTNKLFHFDSASGATDNHFIVSGVTSHDVTSVDIVCVYYSTNQGSVQTQTFATGVPVSGGAFSGVATYPNVSTNCRLIALPSGTSGTDDIASYTGPILYTYTVVTDTDSGHVPYGYTGIGEQGDGIAATTEAGSCGVELMATIALPAMRVLGFGQQECLLGLPSQNVTATGVSTRSALQVDGHNAYLPDAVHTFLIGSRSLPVAQSKLALTFTAAHNGDLTITESSTLMRCATTDAYPPTVTSCPSLVSTGVKFTRVANIFRGAHQVRFRDTFTSTNSAAHKVIAQYVNETTAPPTGATGYTFPGHAGGFSTHPGSTVISGLGKLAGTMLVRSNLRSAEGDGANDTTGVSWSRGPSKVLFAHATGNEFAMSYALTVPKGGKAFIGFAVSNHNTTAATKSLASVATAETVNVPAIGSPASGATVHSHTTRVRGTLTPGANGLPTAVTVDGHAAHLTKVSVTKETYTATLTLSYATHTVKVVAHDAYGNVRSHAIRIHNRK